MCLSEAGTNASIEDIETAMADVCRIQFDLDAHLTGRGLSGESSDAFRSLFITDALTRLRRALADYYTAHDATSAISLDWYLRLNGFEVSFGD